MLEQVLIAYGLNENSSITSFNIGLINHTWKIKTGPDEFVLQRINADIFKQPGFIAENIRMVGDYLAQHYPSYFFCAPIKTLSGDDILHIPEKGYFRMFPFVKDSYSLKVVTNTMQAYEAAKKFGEFTRLLSGFPANDLHIILPGFHDLSLRYRQFLLAVENGNPARIKEAKRSIEFLNDEKYIVDEFELIQASADFKLRVTHHDTKISNVLFDENDKGICVIDLDTLMPGYFISDVGDMLRTYLSPVSEEEKDFSTIELREDYFEAIVKGYLGEMRQILTPFEVQHFVYAGKFMVYMQALRFLTDHLNNDIYYGSAYEGHNLVRAQNQVYLLQLLNEKETFLKQIVEKHSGVTAIKTIA
jgi:Ser/Thr protein kinase RdoA (MazF antagonist)